MPDPTQRPVGPYSSGLPAGALDVRMPDLERFGRPQLWRSAIIAVVLSTSIILALIVWPFRRRGRAIADAAADGLVDGFITLGPTFVKIGQLVASSSGIFPAPLANACLRCLDDVPPFPADQARDIVESDLGYSIAELFAEFDDQPLAAASVAQVHACVLHDGREAVIKIQRPDIYARMLIDLRAAYWGATILEKFVEFLRIANATAIIRDLHTATMTELNSAVEADRQTTFRNNIGAFGDNKGVTTPEVYWDYCGPRVICMERMRGVPLDRFVAGPDGVDEARMLIRRGVKVWLESVIVHGPFHGDVHAGNLWVLDDGRIAMLDFGIVGVLPETWRTILSDMFRATLIDGDFARVARGIRALGYATDYEVDDDQLGLQVVTALAPILGRDLGELKLSELIMALVNLGKQWGVASPEELVLFGKQLGYFERYATALAPGWVIGQDLYLFKNVFPEDIAAKAQQLGITIPD
ncbi:AarF/UbiB family protein [Rhodococcus sp. IEGM 1379]|uniref:ABC1 kinase family protein n=1 Tax=Rhodococcus sp. IEGM 1379 TaxID=3047086 RepID=UPI0024B6689A|nr:AarF/UbiB family protein [Rhodococcus sp. IEGM 1379]MDI9913980.1 AarF/UbiB family protein [Rhodococcus sp. IEGM 1379]